MIHPKVYIIVLNYKNWKDTNDCISSLSKLNYTNFEIIVVDNNSGNGSVDAIKNFIQNNNIFNCFFIANESNLGYASGNNIGIKYALTKNDGNFFWILNNDTEVEMNSLLNLVNYSISNPSKKIIGSILLFHHSRAFIQALGGGYNKWLGTGYNLYEGELWEPNRDYDLSILKYPVGASMFVGIEYIERVGLMTEDYFLYFEEMDWVKRGETVFSNFVGICKDSIVFHKEGASMGNNAKKKIVSSFSEFYSLKNRIKFTRRYYFYALPTVYLGFLVVIFNRIKRRQFKRIPRIIKIMLGII